MYLSPDRAEKTENNAALPHGENRVFSYTLHMEPAVQKNLEQGIFLFRPFVTYTTQEGESITIAAQQAPTLFEPYMDADYLLRIVSKIENN